MNIEDVRSFCMSLRGATESFPFDDETLVFKVGGKIFALANLSGPLCVNLKCLPEKAIELRELHPEVLPGYHMHKAHWNLVSLSGNLPAKMVQEWIIDSYNLVFGALPRKLKETIF